MKVAKTLKNNCPGVDRMRANWQEGRMDKVMEWQAESRLGEVEEFQAAFGNPLQVMRILSGAHHHRDH